MRKILMSGIAISTSLMMMLGYQNCSKKEIRASKTKIKYVEAAYTP